MARSYEQLKPPINAVIKLDMSMPMDIVANRVEVARMVREVRRAIQLWYHATYC